MAMFVRAFIVTTILALALSAPVARREGKVTKGLPMVISQYSNVRHSKNADAALSDAPAARNANTEHPKPAVLSEPAAFKAEAPQPAAPVQPAAVAPETSEKLQESPVPVADPKPEVIPEAPKADLQQPETVPVPVADPAKAEVAEVPAETKPEDVPAPAADLPHAEVAPAPAEPVPVPQDDHTNQEQHAPEPVVETHADANTENKQAEIQESLSDPVPQLPAEPSLNENLAEPVAPVPAAEETHAEPVAPVPAAEETHAEPEHAAAVISEVVSDVLPQTGNIETTEVINNAEVSTEKEESVQEVHEISTEQPAAIVEEAPSVPQVEEAQTGVEEVVAQESESVAVATSVPVEEAEAVKNTEATPKEIDAPKVLPVLSSNSQERSSEIQEVFEVPEAGRKTESDADSQELNNLREARKESHSAEAQAEHDQAKDDTPKLVSKAEKLEKADKLEKAKLTKDKPYKSPKHDDHEDRRKREAYF